MAVNAHNPFFGHTHTHNSEVRTAINLLLVRNRLISYRNIFEYMHIQNIFTLHSPLSYAAEGWNWRTVTEDDAMYMNQTTGERIHPVHFSRR